MATEIISNSINVFIVSIMVVGTVHAKRKIVDRSRRTWNKNKGAATTFFDEFKMTRTGRRTRRRRQRSRRQNNIIIGAATTTAIGKHQRRKIVDNSHCVVLHISAFVIITVTASPPSITLAMMTVSKNGAA